MEILLCLGAHIDDVELSMGGTLLAHRDAGDKIVIAVINSDEYRTGSVEVRQKEQRVSADILGASLHLFRRQEPIEEKIRELDEVRSTIIYLPFPFDSHQDHVETAQIGLAISRLTEMTVLQYLSTTSHSYYPNYISVIDIEKKKQLVSVFKSQMERRPKFMEIMESQNRFFGSLVPENGVFAEGFILHRMVLNNSRREVAK